MDAQELETLGLGMIISLGLLVSEIFLVAMYLAQWRKGLSRAKLQPHLLAIYLLICFSVAAGLLEFYRGESSTPKSALQALVLVSLLPSFIIVVVIILTYVHGRDESPAFVVR